MTENALIAGLGGGLGVLLAAWGTRALLVLASNEAEPLRLAAGVDARVLIFTTAVCLLSCVLFGLAPALDATRRRTSLTVTTTARPVRLWGRALVVLQIAVSVVLKDQVKNRELWSEAHLIKTSNYFVVDVPGQPARTELDGRQDAISKIAEEILARTVEGW